MPLWLLLLLMGLLKVPIAALMLWIPLRSDHAMDARGDAAEQPGSDEGGGSKTLPGDPHRPHPHRPLPTGPRRGPHGSAPPPPPPRIRHGRKRAVTTRH